MDGYYLTIGKFDLEKEERKAVLFFQIGFSYFNKELIDGKEGKTTEFSES